VVSENHFGNSSDGPFAALSKFPHVLGGGSEIGILEVTIPCRTKEDASVILVVVLRGMFWSRMLVLCWFVLRLGLAHDHHGHHKCQQSRELGKATHQMASAVG